jgi:hypothetical protein
VKATSPTQDDEPHDDGRRYVVAANRWAAVKARCGWQRDDLGCDEDEPDSVMGGINLKTMAAWMCGDKQHEQDEKIASLRSRD